MAGTPLTVEDIKKEELNIMKSVHRFCADNGIRYVLIAGTLLGAARHKGFIPWDDDIDIAIPRPDYDRFIATYRDDRYIAKSMEHSDDYVFTFCKVTDTKTELIENKTHRSKLGVNVDVFPLDGIPADKEAAERHARRAVLWRDLIMLKQMKFRKGRSLKKNGILALSKATLAPISYRRLTELAIKHARKYPYDASGLVGNLSWGVGAPDFVDRIQISDRILAPFEDAEFYIPRNYDKILRDRYGDYMQFPPVEQRVTHHGFTAYYLDDKNREDRQERPETAPGGPGSRNDPGVSEERRQ